MVAWIIYHRENAIYNQQYIRFYIEEGAKQGIECKLLLVEEMEFGVREGQWFLIYQKEEIILPDFAICRAIYPLLNRQLEYMGIPVFNHSFVAEICNDKARTYQYLAATGIKMVDTSFYRNDQVKELFHQVKTPTVIKAVAGHGGSQVFLVNGNQEGDVLEYHTLIEKLAGSDVVLQPLTGTRNQDLRVYVIGTEIIAAVLRTAKEGFKSNFSLGGEVSLYQLSDSEIELVNRIIGQFDFGLVGIDFIIGDEGELIFNEIEDVVGSRMLYQCSNINIVEKYLSFIKSKLVQRV
ncbi:MAG: hypothetical protein K0R34_3489 [Herbinix sp.]|jgi:gamma-F420-2:alpha-L-glutamate ligase|nr:hypothetical protein [Herbinix sp.]